MTPSQSGELAEKVREEFEAWITKPPFEREITRWPNSHTVSWPGQYRDYQVELAWCAWQAALDLSPFAAAQDDPVVVSAELPCRIPGASATVVITESGRAAIRKAFAEKEAATAPSPVGLPEEPFSRGAVEMEAYLSMFSGSVDMAFADYVRKLRAYSSAAEQLRDENLEIKRAHLDEHIRANAAEQRVGELEESERSLQTEVEELVDRQEQWRERAEQLQRDLETKRVECDMLYESAGLMKRDLDAASRQRNGLLIACEAAEAILRSGGTFPINGVTWQLLKDAIALAHREPAGGEKK